jgi:hypothetical protein
MKIIHVYNPYSLEDPKEQARLKRAQDTRQELLRAPDYVNCPYELNFNAHLIYRDSSMPPIEDKRKLPFLRDILARATFEAEKSADVILYTNADIILHYDFLDLIRRFFSSKLNQAAYAKRTTFNRPEKEPISPFYPETKVEPVFYDVFLFQLGWLELNWPKIPDFVIGEEMWDTTMVALIRQEAGYPPTTNDNLGRVYLTLELPCECVLHESHEAFWLKNRGLNSPARMYNLSLARQWFKQNQPGVPVLF